MPWPEWLDAWDRAAFLRVHEGLHGLDSPGLDSFLRWANEWGNGFALIGIVGLWIVLAPRPRALLRPLAEVGTALALTALATRLLKHAVAHDRPNKVFPVEFREGRLVEAFGEHLRNHSMPSGHTATAFALALVVAAWAAGIPSAGRRRVARVLAFLVASTTGVARIYAGAHFPTDVIVGAIEGLLCASVALLAVRLVAGRRRPGAPIPPPAAS